ncbi:Cas4 family exonuclease [Nocardia phage P3.1]|nr:Cas4 family exonuclease [Nocardia phage P3.1]
MIRSSERITLKTCSQRWWWSYVEGLTPLNEDTGALWFGTGLHLAFAEFYIPGIKRGRDPRETWAEFCKGTHNRVKVDLASWDDKKEAEFVKAEDLGDAMLENYMDVTQGDPHWEVLSPEQRFKVAIPDRFDPKALLAWYFGTFDLVVRDHNDGFPKVVDHKSAKALPSEQDLAVLNMDDQAGPYITYSTFTLRKMGLIGPKENVKGMEYNFLVKRKKDERPQDEFGRYLNKNGTVSKVQPDDPFLRHYVSRTAGGRKRQIERTQDDIMWMNAMRSGQLPPTKAVSKNNCKFCEFFAMCQVDEAGGDIDDIKRLMYRKRDPYADHREGAVNSKTSLENKRKTGV